MNQALYLYVNTTNSKNFCKPVLSKLKEFHFFSSLKVPYITVFNRRRMQNTFLR